MTIKILVIFAFVLRAALAAEDGPPLIYPDSLARCLRLPIASGLDVVIETNPYYLRGDFDGDGRADYAIAVAGKKTNRMGVLICRGMGRPVLLGADSPVVPSFSNMSGDNFFAPNCAVYSRAESLALRKSSITVPHPVPPVGGETIAMIYEDGISLIYWEGRGGQMGAHGEVSVNRRFTLKQQEAPALYFSFLFVAELIGGVGRRNEFRDARMSGQRQPMVPAVWLCGPKATATED